MEEEVLSTIDQSHIRNFCIIAHIDHGKSTLADRIIEQTGLLTSREMQSQVLDNRHNIQIMIQCKIYIRKCLCLNSLCRINNKNRSVAGCQASGYLIVEIDVSRCIDQVENILFSVICLIYSTDCLCFDHDLDVMPVINKIDLPSAEPERVKEEIEDVIGIDAENAPLISAKTGLNVHEVLEQIVQQIPSPVGDPDAPLQALIFDSKYDSYKGVIVFCTRILCIRDRISDTGILYILKAGCDISYHSRFECVTWNELSRSKSSNFYNFCFRTRCHHKNVKDTRVGDTITNAENPCAEPLPGYKKVNPMVYCGLYPADGAKYPDLRDALEKLQLNDAALQFEAETSVALGFGFRCGFLGLLHLEIIQERLERCVSSGS